MSDHPALEDFAKHELTMDEARKIIKLWEVLLSMTGDSAGATVRDFAKPLDEMARNLRRNMSMISVALDEYEKNNGGGNEDSSHKS